MDINIIKSEAKKVGLNPDKITEEEFKDLTYPFGTYLFIKTMLRLFPGNENGNITKITQLVPILREKGVIILRNLQTDMEMHGGAKSKRKSRKSHKKRKSKRKKSRKSRKSKKTKRRRR